MSHIKHTVGHQTFTHTQNFVDFLKFKLQKQVFVEIVG